MPTQTLTKLHEMKLHGMAKSFETNRIRPKCQDLSHDEFMALLTDDEFIYRQNNRQRRLLQMAKLKFSSAALESIDYSHTRGITKVKVTGLQNNQWLEKHQNILITGATGVGKSYLACAFGQWACRNGQTPLPQHLRSSQYPVALPTKPFFSFDTSWLFFRREFDLL